MLMDLFFANATAIKQKRRVHFHTFMLEVHERIYNWKQQFESSSHNLDLRPERDAIAHVSDDEYLSLSLAFLRRIRLGRE